MGIDVNAAKVVTFNPGHERRVVTDPNRPVPSTAFGDLHVVSVFRRRRVKHDEDDGNPLIYALKRKFGYTIAASDLRQIVRAGHQILPAALDGTSFDLVVPLPSSSPVASILARRASRMAGGCDVVSCLDKATVAQVLASAPHPDAIQQRDRRIFTSHLATLQRLPGDSVIEMKTVPLRVRHHFTPIVANALVDACAGRHILLVDDIVGSGSSLVAAAAALGVAGAGPTTALTLLSRLS